jgi:glycosyltransferase involved in cell wall biosynthesis
MIDSELTIVIPAYNEAPNLQPVISEVLQAASSNNWKVILVNDGSRDDTPQVLAPFLKHPKFQVLEHSLNKGYGAALKTGLSQAQTQYVLSFDADGQHNVADIPRLLEAAKSQNADLVIGSRKTESSSFRGIGKAIIKAFARSLMPLPIEDLNSGLKLYKTGLVKLYLPLCPNGMSFSDILTLLFINQRNKVIELPIQIRSRQDGKSTISVLTAFETLMSILNISMMFNPLRIFLPLSLLSLLAGLAWGLPIIFAGRGVSVGSLLMLITAAIFFSIGLIAAQVAAVRQQLLDMQRFGRNFPNDC